MNEIDQENLDYLHDADLISISIRIDEGGTRRLIIEAQYVKDCGNTRLNGKKVVISFKDLVFFNGTYYGYIYGGESINGFSKRVSEVASAYFKERGDQGFSPPRIILGLALQSGSEFDIACDEVEIVITEP